MADMRYYAKIDVGYLANPKLSDLIDDRPRVILVHLGAVLYCRQHLTDGTFPIRSVMRSACGTYCGSQCEGQCDFCAATDAGLFERIDNRLGQVHDYLKHQDSADKAAQRKAAGQKGAATRWAGQADADRNAKGNADRIATTNAKGNAEERRGEDSKEQTSASAGSDRFNDFWLAYPKKDAKGQAVKAWRAALKKTDAQTIIDGLAARAHQWAGTERQFIPLPATWLNGERWADELEPATDAGSGWNATPEHLKTPRYVLCDECERPLPRHFRTCSQPDVAP